MQMGETSEVVHTEESLGHCSNASYELSDLRSRRLISKLKATQQASPRLAFSRDQVTELVGQWERQRSRSRTAQEGGNVKRRGSIESTGTIMCDIRTLRDIRRESIIRQREHFIRFLLDRAQMHTEYSTLQSYSYASVGTQDFANIQMEEPQPHLIEESSKGSCLVTKTSQSELVTETVQDDAQKDISNVMHTESSISSPRKLSEQINLQSPEKAIAHKLPQKKAAPKDISASPMKKSTFKPQPKANLDDATRAKEKSRVPKKQPQQLSKQTTSQQNAVGSESILRKKESTIKKNENDKREVNDSRITRPRSNIAAALKNTESRPTKAKTRPSSTSPMTHSVSYTENLEATDVSFDQVNGGGGFTPRDDKNDRSESPFGQRMRSSSTLSSFNQRNNHQDPPHEGARTNSKNSRPSSQMYSEKHNKNPPPSRKMLSKSYSTVQLPKTLDGSERESTLFSITEARKKTGGEPTGKKKQGTKQPQTDVSVQNHSAKNPNIKSVTLGSFKAATKKENETKKSSLTSAKQSKPTPTKQPAKETKTMPADKAKVVSAKNPKRVKIEPQQGSNPGTVLNSPQTANLKPDGSKLSLENQSSLLAGSPNQRLQKPTKSERSSFKGTDLPSIPEKTQKKAEEQASKQVIGKINQKTRVTETLKAYDY